jgi:hypothetical protein
MPLELGERTAVLSGAVSVDEAEPLAEWLRRTPSPAVDLARCVHLHTAALQALLAADVTVTVAPADGFLASRVMPLLRLEPATDAKGAQ